uniref:Uncharacterized protein n=1 Tax=Timema cristinae TaxID=61476 RepID=A0A7R9CBX9_TIMCR|nr:unnamed protein product [Timema cristinae]
MSAEVGGSDVTSIQDEELLRRMPGTTAGITRYLTASPRLNTTRRGGYEYPDLTPRSPPNVSKGVHDAVPDTTAGMSRSVLITEAPNDGKGEYGLRKYFC